MRKWVEIEVDADLVHEVVRRFRLADSREAVQLALRTLLDDELDDAAQQLDEEYDEFSDMRALQLPSAGDAG